MASTERRRRNRNVLAHPLELRLSYLDAAGVQQIVPAHIVDISDFGLGLQLGVALQVGAIVTLLGSAKTTELHLPPRAKVCWTGPMVSGFYRAGVRYEDVGDGRAEPESDVDLYEVLEVSPKASPETIHRVYRLLAQQVHPDNRQSGDEELFQRLVRAYRVLSDPERRAAYDIERGGMLRSRWRPFVGSDSTHGLEAERSRRHGVLKGLLAKRMCEPHSPAMTMFEIEDLLGVPRDHLEFTLWYLKERGFVVRSDNNRYQITVSGVDQAELLEREDSTAKASSPVTVAVGLIGGK